MINELINFKWVQYLSFEENLPVTLFLKSLCHAIVTGNKIKDTVWNGGKRGSKKYLKP